MSSGRWNSRSKIKAVAFCVLAGASVASWPAQAETIFLQCGSGTELQSITVDLANNTVNNQPATINETSIDWQHSGVSTCDGSPSFCAEHAGTFVSTSHIDRTSGTYTWKTLVNLPGGGTVQLDPVTASCTKVSAPATKF